MTDPNAQARPEDAAWRALWPEGDPRAEAFGRWLAPLVQAHGLDPSTLRAASADASFRRYFRIDRAGAPHAGNSAIVMDAPPPQEDVRPFLDVAGRIARAGLRGPAVLAADAAQGFLLLEDLGPQIVLTALDEARRRGDEARVEALMRAAVASLVQWQTRIDPSGLPEYDEAMLRRELALFPDWCVQREFGRTWDAREQATWQMVCDRLVASALDQPRVAVHRDWMPRNLMTPAGDPSEPPGILDFQDAVRGPVTYDIASLLRDAFLSWDEAQELDWAVRWWQQARAADLLAGSPMEADFGQAWRAIEWMGLQRHLKILGIFSRLKHRDGKPRYAEDLPRFFAYAARVTTRYVELKPLLPLLESLAGPLTQQGVSLR